MAFFSIVYFAFA